MSQLIVPVVKIDELLPIVGADRIVLAKVLGFSCIVSKDKYQIGDSVIYLPVDTLIPNSLIEKFGLEFVRKNRISCLKLKGVFSEGLILDNFLNAKLGANVADKIGAEKWEPPEPAFAQNKPREIVSMYWVGYFKNQIPLWRAIKKTFTVTYDQYLKPRKKVNPLFCKYTDIQNIKHYPDLFKPEDIVVITEKAHGSNFRAGYLKRRNDGIIDNIIQFFRGEFEFVYGSHNVQKSVFSGKGYYGEDVYGQVAQLYSMSSVCKKYENYIFYGEVIGPNIQKGFDYDLKALDLRIFDIKDLKENKYLDWTRVKAICTLERIPTVPELYHGPFSVEKVAELTVGKSTFAKHIREGVVVKTNPEQHDDRVGRKILKSISPDYLLIKDRTDYH